ncbi:TonB-dependent receptor plug domain-containing protein [Gloeobacter violaceus]|uniref:Glr1610 protein n=1 Tax=Gloeobacter violaceus (strain ATCC 29082 / PCC 7421) TaxID=251221 RepID=Q7NK68_GLOVI|nr:TonB-dependent receptor [Gloeobacter violaceus]BAC89551.1 glr1610 [Gloeobacter violaceus PCC 7421]
MSTERHSRARARPAWNWLLFAIAYGWIPAVPSLALPTVADLLPDMSTRAGDLLVQSSGDASPAEPTSPGNDSDLLPAVTVTATRRSEPILDVPTATTIVPSAQAQERTQTDLADLLRGETGVYVRATNPSAGSPVIRGATGRDVLLLVDGFRLSPAFARPNVQYQSLVDPFFIDQIEIVRGPVSTLYGSDAMGGATNVITPSFKAGEPAFRLHTDYNTNPAGSSTYFQYQGGSERAWAMMGLTYRSFGDLAVGAAPDLQVIFPNPTARIGRSGYEYYGANFKGEVRLADNQFLTLTTQYSRIPTVQRQDGIIQGYGENVTSAQRGFSPQGRTFFLGEYRAVFNHSWLDEVRVRLGYQQIQDDRFQRNFARPRPSFPDYGSGTPSPDITLESNFSDLIGTSAVLKSTWGNNVFTYGAEAYFDLVGSTRSIRNDTTGTIPDPNGSRYVDGSTFNQYGLFVQDEIDWSTQFKTLLGLRYSLVDVSVPFSAVRPNSSGFGRRFEALTANAGFLYRFERELQFVMNLGTGFRAPNINDLGNAGERRASDINLPNSSLNPEKVFSVDGGLRWAGSDFKGEVIGFWSRYTDRITSQSVGTVVNSDGSTSEVFQSVNRDNETIWGIELGGRYRLGDVWSLFATGTFTYAEAPLVGETVIPPFNGVLGVRFEPTAGAYIEPYLRYATYQGRLSENNLTDTRINPNGTPGFVVPNLRAGFPLSGATTLRVNVNNVLNTNYREHGTTLDAPGFGVNVGIDALF